MITEKQAKEIVFELEGCFKGSKPKISGNQNGYTVAVVVLSVDGLELQILKSIVSDSACEFKMKRSGTGISIQFN